MATTPRGSFSNANRHMQEEETLQLTSVGVDIGSSTSHLVFSRLELTLEGSRYRVTKREILNESEILLTPYVDDTRIDVEALESFINEQYKNGENSPRRSRYRRADSYRSRRSAAQRARHCRIVRPGSGKVRRGQRRRRARSDDGRAWLGSRGALGKNWRRCTEYRYRRRHQQIAICNNGKVQEVSAIDIGARLLAFDKDSAIVRIEEAARKHAGWAGFSVELGQKIPEENLRKMVSGMIDKLFAMLKPESINEDIKGLLRLPPLSYHGEIDCVMFSGGVSEFIYNRTKTSFGDLGPFFAERSSSAHAVIWACSSWSPTRAFAPPSSARHSTPSRSVATRSSSPRTMRFPYATLPSSRPSFR